MRSNVDPDRTGAMMNTGARRSRSTSGSAGGRNDSAGAFAAVTGAFARARLTSKPAISLNAVLKRRLRSTQHSVGR
jgi:hypothetical protein